MKTQKSNLYLRAIFVIVLALTAYACSTVVIPQPQIPDPKPVSTKGATFTGIFTKHQDLRGDDGVVEKLIKATGVDFGEQFSSFNLTQTGNSISGTYTFQNGACPSSQLSVKVTGEINSNNVATLNRPSSKVICSPQVSISVDKSIYDVSLTKEGNLKVTQRGNSSYEEIFIRQR